MGSIPRGVRGEGVEVLVRRMRILRVQPHPFPMRSVIMAGGGGTRLWPVSRAAHPKQFHRLTGNHSLLQETVLRVRPLTDPAHTYITTNRAFVNEIRFQLMDLPEGNVIVEPAKRDNAAAIALAVARLLHDTGGEDDTMVMLPADHVILNPDAFRELIRAADGHVQKHPETIVTVGIRPTYPETGFGYIKMHLAERWEGGDHEFFRVERFTEKPKREVAEQFVRDISYLWNAGIFVFRMQTMRKLIAEFLPEIAEGMETISAAFGSANEQAALEEIYPTLPATSIDYGIMEKAPSVTVVPASTLGWSDVGNWQALRDALPKDAEGNVIHGQHVGINTTGSLIHGGRRMIGTIGVNDLIIVDTDDALLVADATHVAQIKELLDRIKDAARDDLL